MVKEYKIYKISFLLENKLIIFFRFGTYGSQFELRNIVIMVYKKFLEFTVKNIFKNKKVA